MGVQAHGALVDILGTGVLLVGRSGVGKSECALELVRRGHALVADDVVRIERRGEILTGAAPEVIRHTIEIRGIGLLYLPDLYGEKAVRDECSIDLVCRLLELRAGVEFERIGLERKREIWAEVSLPVLSLPARLASSTATLVEVAALDHGLRAQGRATGAERIDARFQRAKERES